MAEDADRMVARAIESVLDQVPGTVDTNLPEGGSAKLQPWAETAAPVGRNKRPLEDLLAELAERVAAAPTARANLPGTRHPALAFFDRFGRGGRGQQDGPGDALPGEGTGKRRRRRRGAGAGRAPSAAEPVATAESGPAQRAPGTGRRRRRGRGGGGGQGSGSGSGGQSQADAAPSTPQNQQQRPQGGGGRRRRGRRGRGPGSSAQA